MQQTIRAGVVGTGYVSHHHLRALKDLPFVEIVGVADTDAARAALVAAKVGGSGVYQNLAEMAAAKPDVIHVLTPPSSHKSLTLEALDMGCHVFVEKPMAESL